MVDSLDTIKRTTMADRVFERLHRWIVSGRFKPGEVLPSQDVLAKQLNVSRNTLREAVFRLSTLGLVQSKQGVGTVVLPLSPSNYIGNLQDHLLLDEATINEFIEARLFAERTMVRLAVARATEANLKSLEEALEGQRRAVEVDDAVEFNTYDVNFHLELGRACGNSVMLKFFEAIWGLLNNFVAKSNTVPGKITRSYRSHRRIYEAIRDRDVERADAELIYHIHKIANWAELIAKPGGDEEVERTSG